MIEMMMVLVVMAMLLVMVMLMEVSFCNHWLLQDNPIACTSSVQFFGYI